MIKSNYYLFFLLFLCACQSNPPQQANTHTSEKGIPSLLTRSEFLGSDEERNYITKSYQLLCRDIESGANVLENKLKLAQLFMLEARTTGEHGHYYPAALQLIDEILEDKPTNDIRAQALLLKGSVLLSLHEFKDAEKVGREAVSLNPHQALIYGVLVDAHVELGEYDKAVKMADKMVEIRPDLRSYARVSYLREIHGDIQGAIDAMELAISAGVPGFEDVAWCRLTLAELYENYGKPGKAKEQYQLILSERPNYPFAIAGLAGLAGKDKRYIEADSLYQRACKIIPEVAFYEEKAELYEQMGRREEADAIKRDILKMLADDEAHGHKMTLEYAYVYRDLFRDNEQALIYALEAYQQRPKNIDTNKLLASIYLNQGALDKAITHIDNALRTNSQDPELLCIAGLIYSKNGAVKKGKKLLLNSKGYNPHQDHEYFKEAMAFLSQ